MAVDANVILNSLTLILVAGITTIGTIWGSRQKGRLDDVHNAVNDVQSTANVVETVVKDTKKIINGGTAGVSAPPKEEGNAATP